MFSENGPVFAVTSASALVALGMGRPQLGQNAAVSGMRAAQSGQESGRGIAEAIQAHLIKTHRRPQIGRTHRIDGVQSGVVFRAISTRDSQEELNVLLTM